MLRIRVDKIASVTRNMGLGRTLTLDETILVEHGSVIAGRVWGEKSVYNQLEDVHGRLSTVHQGDIIVGALGHRNALQGYEGVMPERAAPGDRLHLLNMGGVIGRCVSHNPSVGRPFEVELLGQVLVFPEFQSRVGRPATVRAFARRGDAGPAAPTRVPVVFVAGTCMNAGKTAAASVVVRALAAAGLRVGATKLTGVSLMRDVLGMRDYGADVALDFTDAGVVCTSADNAAGAARVLFAELKAEGVDVIVAEMGDGIMGEYGVQALLGDPELMADRAVFVLCANDPVGAAGGVEALRRDFGIAVDLVAGPATDNRVGVRFVEQRLGLPARNAFSDPAGLGQFVLEALERRRSAA